MEELKLIRDNYWATKDGRIYSTKRNVSRGNIQQILNGSIYKD